MRRTCSDTPGWTFPSLCGVASVFSSYWAIIKNHFKSVKIEKSVERCDEGPSCWSVVAFSLIGGGEFIESLCGCSDSLTCQHLSKSAGSSPVVKVNLLPGGKVIHQRAWADKERVTAIIHLLPSRSIETVWLARHFPTTAVGSDHQAYMWCCVRLTENLAWSSCGSFWASTYVQQALFLERDRPEVWAGRESFPCRLRNTSTAIIQRTRPLYV